MLERMDKYLSHSSSRWDCFINFYITLLTKRYFEGSSVLNTKKQLYMKIIVVSKSQVTIKYPSPPCELLFSYIFSLVFSSSVNSLFFSFPSSLPLFFHPSLFPFFFSSLLLPFPSYVCMVCMCVCTLNVRILSLFSTI